MIPLLGQLVILALIYPTVCVTAKRLHDFGRSGWLAAVPYVIAAAAMLIGAVTGGMTMMLGGLAGHGVAAAAAVGGMGIMAGVMGLTLLAELAFLLWVGLSKGDPQPNAYGAPAPSVFGGAAPTPV
jgi:uncharacterized membrane protein YhaH (DUF805 family)